MAESVKPCGIFGDHGTPRTVSHNGGGRAGGGTPVDNVVAGESKKRKMDSKPTKFSRDSDVNGQKNWIQLHDQNNTRIDQKDAGGVLPCLTR